MGEHSLSYGKSNRHIGSATSAAALRCASWRQFKTDSKRGSNSREEQKVFWLLCLAYAPARGDEKPGGSTERGCSDLKQEFKKGEREEGMAFSRESVDLVKVGILVEVKRGEVVITFGEFPSVQGRLWNRPYRCAANFYNVSLSQAIPCTFLTPIFSDSCGWVRNSVLFLSMFLTLILS